MTDEQKPAAPEKSALQLTAEHINANYRVICIGNREAREYARHPQPPSLMPDSLIEEWAENMCRIDLSKIPKVGEFVKDIHGNDSYEVTPAHRVYFVKEAIGAPFHSYTHSGVKLCTRIHISPDSTLLQAVQECINNWRGNQSAGAVPLAEPGHNPPWISGNDPALVAILAQELKAGEIREFEITGGLE